MIEPHDYDRRKMEDFRNRLDQFMCDDNPKDDHAEIEAGLDAEARGLGFENWLDAYHRFSPRETEMDRLMRVAFVTDRPKEGQP